MAYDEGDRVRITGTWTEADGSVIDPDKVFFRHATPAGVLTTYEYDVGPEIVRASKGIYYVDLDLDSSGWWYNRVWSTGVGKAAEESKFFVDPKRI